MGNNINITLKNLRFYIKQILICLRDLDFVAADRDKWGAVVNMVMSCPVHEVIGSPWLADKLSACQ